MLEGSAEIAHQEPEQVERHELRRSDHALQREAERVEGDQVEQQVAQVRVDEAADEQARIARPAGNEIGAQQGPLQEFPGGQADRARGDDQDKQRRGSQGESPLRSGLKRILTSTPGGPHVHANRRR